MQLFHFVSFAKIVPFHLKLCAIFLTLLFRQAISLLYVIILHNLRNCFSVGLPDINGIVLIAFVVQFDTVVYEFKFKLFALCVKQFAG